jgi:outer membrane protein
MKLIPVFLCLVFSTVALTASAADGAKALTLKEARDLALRKHPKITVAQLQALAAKQAVREAQSGFLPNLSANFGAVGTEDGGTRIASSGLPVSSVFSRASAAINLTQLVTDFGRTANLTDSSKLHARAAEENVEATRAQIILQVDAAYFGALQAEAVLRVAQETAKSRELLRDRVSALASNQLKSELDASFAEVNFQDAKLGSLKAENEVQSSFATLGALLDSREAGTFRLVEEPLAAPPATDAAALVSTALNERPELLRLRLERDSALKFARAERAQHYPTLSLQGTAGVFPYRDEELNQDYAAAGIILNVPIFSGNLYDARSQAAALRAQAAEAALHDEENNVVRDVRIAWFNASNAHERLAVAAKLLEQAKLSYTLADARYKAGTSSIVELSQAELNLTSAQLTAAAARYEYLVRRSILDFQTGQSM